MVFNDRSNNCLAISSLVCVASITYIKFMISINVIAYYYQWYIEVSFYYVD